MAATETTYVLRVDKPCWVTVMSVDGDKKEREIAGLYVGDHPENLTAVAFWGIIKAAMVAYGIEASTLKFTTEDIQTLLDSLAGAARR